MINSLGSTSKQSAGLLYNELIVQAKAERHYYRWLKKAEFLGLRRSEM